MFKTIALVLALLSPASPAAQIPEQDSRNADVHDTDTHFRMPVFTSREAWQEHLQMPHVRALQEKAEELLDGPLEVTLADCPLGATVTKSFP